MGLFLKDNVSLNSSLVSSRAGTSTFWEIPLSTCLGKVGSFSGSAYFFNALCWKRVGWVGLFPKVTPLISAAAGS